MSKARLVITAVVQGGMTQAEAAATYQVSKGWVSKLLTRYRAEGEAAFVPRSRRPTTSPTAIADETIEQIVRLRKELAGKGLDAGPHTIAWHLDHHHGVTVSVATISRYLTARGLITPEPKKKPKSAFLTFAAEQPNERWQSDFTHYRLTRTDGQPGTDSEILSWLDDHARYALRVTAHHRVTGPIVLAEFRSTVAAHGTPASTLTDNGMVFTTRLSGGKRGAGTRNGFEHELRRLGVIQINSTPNHPTTCGKVERFQQTMKKWLRAQNPQPTSIGELQTLLDRFVAEYNHHRPHRSLPHRCTPAVAYTARPKAIPGDRSTDSHNRVRHDKVDTSGKITLRYQGQLYSIGIGRTHARTRVIVLVQDLAVRIIDAATGELLRELTLDPTKRYQPTGRPPGPPPRN